MFAARSPDILLKTTLRSPRSRACSVPCCSSSNRRSAAMRSGRRLLYSPDYVRGFANALREARDDLDDMHCRHVAAMADLHRELDQCRAEFNQLRAAVLARQHADAELAGLYRGAVDPASARGRPRRK